MKIDSTGEKSRRTLDGVRMSLAEIQEIGQQLAGWQGAQLQEVLVDGQKKSGGGWEPRSLRLGFFHQSRVKWLLFDYDQETPFLVVFPTGKPPDPQKIRRPLELFLRSSFVGRRLAGVTVAKRVDEPQLELSFGEGALLRFLVVPRFRNIWAHAGEKTISEFKPIPVPKELPHGAALGEGARSVDELSAAWLIRNSPRQLAGVPTSVRSGGPLEEKRKRLEKRKKALEKVQLELETKLNHPARSIGEWIKTHQTLDVPTERRDEWEQHIDRKLNLAKNIEQLFRTAKSQEGKINGTKQRHSQLQEEVAKLQLDIERGIADAAVGVGGPAQKDLFQAAKAQGRKFQLAEDLTFFIGKNGKENLAILRKAQPFDYWLHVKDQPGAHGIIRRSRARIVSDQEFVKAATNLLENSLKRRAISLKGESFDILIVECRFVRPIKGDRLGRVQYSNDRVMRVRF